MQPVLTLREHVHVKRHTHTHTKHESVCLGRDHQKLNKKQPQHRRGTSETPHSAYRKDNCPSASHLLLISIVLSCSLSRYSWLLFLFLSSFAHFYPKVLSSHLLSHILARTKTESATGLLLCAFNGQRRMKNSPIFLKLKRETFKLFLNTRATRLAAAAAAG